MIQTRKPVNVASVPQRSPFRYPGGKTWLVPLIRRWMRSLSVRPDKFIEPFAGGASVGLSVAFEGAASKVVLVERDEDIAAVWRTILSHHAGWLIDRILCFEMTAENIRGELQDSSKSIRHRAFCTILRNRTLHGGILARGSSFIRYGENGKGLLSRWYPETLARRIQAIYEIRSRLDFVEGDGFPVIRKYLTFPNVAFFLDPPYTASRKKAGKRLYNYSQIDHEGLFDLMSRVGGEFLMTYDDDIAVEAMARSREFVVDRVPMQSRRLNVMNELLISDDLTWLKTGSDEQGSLFRA